jgi:hypothetical protein
LKICFLSLELSFWNFSIFWQCGCVYFWQFGRVKFQHIFVDLGVSNFSIFWAIWTCQYFTKTRFLPEPVSPTWLFMPCLGQAILGWVFFIIPYGSILINLKCRVFFLTPKCCVLSQSSSKYPFYSHWFYLIRN